MINGKRRLAVLVMFAVAMMAVVAFAAGKVKKHHHHSGHAMLGAKLKTNGTHQIHKNGKHTVSAEVKNGKVAAIHVKHDTKGDVPVKKYKTNKKMALIDTPPSEAQPADTIDNGTVWIGYAYVDDEGNEEYYWFPYEEILDGDTGAVEYVPLS